MATFSGWAARGLIWLATTLTSGPAMAQAPAPPDVVVLKDGGRLRGTISELVPGGPVTIVLITGETRRLAADVVAYAGPATSEPGALDADPWPPPVNAAPPPDPAPSTEVGNARAAPTEERGIVSVPVRFVSDRRGAELSVRRVGERTPKICLAPCTLDFEPDVYGIAVRFPDDDEASGFRELTLDRHITVSVDYKSREGLRDVGVLVAGLSLALGGLSFFYMAAADRPNGPVAYTGLVSGLGGIIAGLSLWSVGDDVSLTVK